MSKLRVIIFNFQLTVKNFFWIKQISLYVLKFRSAKSEDWKKNRNWRIEAHFRRRKRRTRKN